MSNLLINNINNRFSGVIGILGGLGPEAAADSFLSLVRKCLKATNPQCLPPIALWNVPIPIALDEAMMKGTFSREEEIQFKNLLKDGFRRLIQAGATIIVMACNTAHAYLDFLDEPWIAKGPCKFISILDGVNESLMVQGGQARAVGILGTDLTLKSQLYQSGFKRLGIRYLEPEEGDQAIVMNCINLILQGKYNTGQHGVKEQLLQVCERLRKRGADKILLSCTELPLAFKSETEDDLDWIIDPMDLLENKVLTSILVSTSAEKTQVNGTDSALQSPESTPHSLIQQQ